MKVIVLGGFLGSGKTSLLLLFLQHLVSKLPDNGKRSLIVIENEIGQTGIDDKILKSAGLSVQGLESGCACCEMNADLLMCVNRIQANLSPQWLIIEASGVAVPSNIVETLALHGQGITSIKNVVVADAERLENIKKHMR